jgi:RHS repeat-associated protein
MGVKSGKSRLVVSRFRLGRALAGGSRTAACVVAWLLVLSSPGQALPTATTTPIVPPGVSVPEPPLFGGRLPNLDAPVVSVPDVPNVGVPYTGPEAAAPQVVPEWASPQTPPPISLSPAMRAALATVPTGLADGDASAAGDATLHPVDTGSVPVDPTPPPQPTTTTTQSTPPSTATPSSVVTAPSSSVAPPSTGTPTSILTFPSSSVPPSTGTPTSVVTTPSTAVPSPSPTGNDALASAATRGGLAALESPQAKVTAASDGSLHADLSSDVARVQDPSTGTWREVNSNLVEAGDGRFAPAMASTPVSFAQNAAGAAQVGSRAGTFSVQHVNAGPVDGRVVDGTLIYDGALSGSTVRERANASGFSETVQVVSHDAGNSYLESVTMPPGTSARATERSIEFVDTAGAVVATFAGGIGWDAAPAITPVTVTLVSSSGPTALVQVSVPASWFDSPAREFPITIDPDFLAGNSAPQGAFGCYSQFSPTDCTWSTVSNANPNTYIGKDPTTAQLSRTELQVPLHWNASPGPASLEDNPHIRVDSANLGLDNILSARCGVSFGTGVYILMLSGWKGINASWTNPSPLTSPVYGVTTNWTGNSGGSSACPELQAPDITSLVQRWVYPGPSGHAMPNYGLGLYAQAESSTDSLKVFSGAPSIAVNFDYYNATYGAPRSWVRQSGVPQDFYVWVKNTGFTTWSTPRYQMAVSTLLGGVATNVATGTVVAGTPSPACTPPPTTCAPSTDVLPGSWAQYLVHFPSSLPVGTYTLGMTMKDTLHPSDGQFDFWGVAPRADAFQVVPAADLGVPPNATLDGGLVNTYNGNVHTETTDLSVPTAGPALTVDRSYNSLDGSNGWFGRGWTSSYETRLNTVSGGVTVVQPDGRVEYYKQDPDGPAFYLAQGGAVGTVADIPAHGSVPEDWVLIDGDDAKFHFNPPSGSVAGQLNAIEDTNGLKLQIAYSSGTPSVVTNLTSGRTLTFTWTTTGGDGPRVASVTSDRVSASDPTSALTWKYYYDGYGRLIQACDPTLNSLNGHCTKYAYDGSPGTGGSRQIDQITSPEGNTDFRVDYEAGGVYTSRVAHRFDGLNNEWQYDYSTYSGGASTQYRTAVRDPLSNPANSNDVTTYAYTVDARIAWSLDPLGTYHRFIYDDTIDPNLPAPPDHDAQGVLTRTYQQNSAGQISSSTTYAYDAKNRLTQQTDAYGHTTYTDYDADGHVLHTRDPRSSSATDATYATTYAYDTAGRKITRTSPIAGIRHRWSYTDGTEVAEDSTGTPDLVPAGLVETETDENGNVTRNFYNHNGDLARVVRPDQLTTTYLYDGIGRQIIKIETCPTTEPAGVAACQTWQATLVTVTSWTQLSQIRQVSAPVVSAHVPGLTDTHQQITTNSYDLNGNLTQVDIGDNGNHPDATRTTKHDFNDNDVEWRTTDAEGGITSRTFDADGNLATLTDPNTNVHSYSYDRDNRQTQTRLLNYVADKVTNPPAVPLVQSTTTYDGFGRKATVQDALGRVRSYTYDNDDRPTSVTLLGFHTSTGTTRNIVLELDGYDAAGNITTKITGGGRLTVLSTYDALGRLGMTQEDPADKNRITVVERDGNGNVTKRTVVDGHLSLAGLTVMTYDAMNHVTSQAVTNTPSADLITRFQYDGRGNRVATTDPRATVLNDVNFTTTTQYDEMDQAFRTIAPAVTITTLNRATGVLSAPFGPFRPDGYTAHDTFGDVVRTVDANGNATKTTYDRLGRKRTVTYPTYTPIDGSAPITPTETFNYDANGNVTSHVDRRGQTTSYAYTQLDQVYLQTDPAVTPIFGSPSQSTVHTVYDVQGNKAQVIDQNGASIRYEVDDLDRVRYLRQDVRNSGGGVTTDTTKYGYDDQGHQIQVTDPALNLTVKTWSPLDELLTVSRPSNAPTGTAVTTSTYDLMSRPLRTTNPPLTAPAAGPNSATDNDYDLAGRLLSTTRTDLSTNTSVTSTIYGYDPAGNRVSVQTLNGQAGNYATTRTYDGLNRLLEVDQPTTPTHTITTTYAYDAVGNLTQVRDGRGNATTPASSAYDIGYSYTSGNQRDLVVQPSTVAGQTLADRETKTVFDAGGLPVIKIEPAGGTTTTTRDELGRAILEVTSTSDVQFFFYDALGHLTQDAELHNTYDDRGLLVNVTGTTGTAAYTYDNDGRLTGRTDVAGTAAFTWTRQSLPATATDLLTNTKQTYSWDNDNQLNSIDYATLPSTTIGTRTYSYDAAGRTLSDSYADSGTSTQRWFNTYQYDPDGNVTSKAVGPTGVTGAGTTPNLYTYDQADRLVSYTPAGSATATTYGYDDAGNRTQFGTNFATFDARSRITASFFFTYAWAPNGNLTTVHNTSNGTDTTSTYDGFDRLIENKTVTSGGTTTADTTFSYDDLDRIASRNTTAFTYEGMNPDPISDGTFTATHDANGHPIAYKTGTTARLTITNQHNDVSALINTSNGTLASSASYDPYGVRTGTTPPALGYQGDYTDATTGQTDMGARWYAPNVDTFTTQDTYTGQTDNPITQNAFTYGANNPLTYNDPTGHSATCTVPGTHFRDDCPAKNPWWPYNDPGPVGNPHAQPTTGGTGWVAGNRATQVYIENGGDPCHCHTEAEIWLNADYEKRRGDISAQYSRTLFREAAIEQNRNNAQYRQYSDINTSTSRPRTVGYIVPVPHLVGLPGSKGDIGFTLVTTSDPKQYVSLIRESAGYCTQFGLLLPYVGGGSSAAVDQCGQIIGASNSFRRSPSFGQVLLVGGTIVGLGLVTVAACATDVLCAPALGLDASGAGAAGGDAVAALGDEGAIATTRGLAEQTRSLTALAARSDVEGGATLYRIGTTGTSAGPEGQFWSLEPPSSPDFASRYGIPPSNVANADFIETARLVPNTPFVTRVAPGVGSNLGGGIEVVVPEGGVQMCSFSYTGPKGC